MNENTKLVLAGVATVLATTLVMLPILFGWAGWTLDAIALAAIFVAGLRQVPESEAWVTETFGSFFRILQPGLSWMFPFVETLRAAQTFREQVLDIPKQETLTMDGTNVTLDTVLYYRLIRDNNYGVGGAIYRATYGVETEAKDPKLPIRELARATLRNIVGSKAFDDAVDHQEDINREVVAYMAPAVLNWGFEVMRHEIQEFDAPPEIKAALQKPITALREKTAAVTASEAQRDVAVNVAEGEKKAAIARAEATKQQQILTAQGEAEAIERLATAISKDRGAEAVNFQIASKAIPEFGKLAQEGTHTIIPADLGTFLGPIRAISDALKPATTSPKK